MAKTSDLNRTIIAPKMWIRLPKARAKPYHGLLQIRAPQPQLTAVYPKQTGSAMPNHINLCRLCSDCFFVCSLCFAWMLLFVGLPNKLQANDLASQIQPLIESHRGDVSVIIKNLETGETYSHNPEAVMPTASLIKFPILIELYRQAEAGSLGLDKMITLRQEDKVPGSGILTEHFEIGTQIPLVTAARLMITYSDNTATNLVLDQIGLSSTAQTMAEFGLPETQVHSKVFRRDSSIQPARSQRYGLGSTTAKDMLSLLERLHQRTLLKPESCEAILGHLATCDDRSKLVRRLPSSVKSFHKTGAVNECRTDAGLFKTPAGTLAMIVLTANNKDTRWTEDNEAEVLCASIGEIAVRYFNANVTPEPIDSEILKLGSNGVLVEALQRALNQQVRPTPELSVDGDFGPMTESAVRHFQSTKQLSVTGTVDRATWAALGPVELEEPNRPDTELAGSSNPQDVTIQEEPTVGPPFVSCKSWIIIDSHDGRVIDSYEATQQLEMASVTKMMTAWLIARWIEMHPDALNEKVTFSERADQTPGSSTTIRAGETVTVEQLLYGLMLPSGNDAATALAEHFGDRLHPKDENLIRNPYDKFVLAMNREATATGMNHTSFRNPHGWPDKEHFSTCVDLAHLARMVMRSQLLRKIVATTSYECEALGREGYVRKLRWKNSNELLNRKDYLGIKTGTTDSAGACLVSCSQREGREIIVVTLGASGSAARYADTRNLHRWAWQKLFAK
jgi:D-alanyl-D-alanine carboxypeptidase (penicillin-binding protein 5/6)